MNSDDYAALVFAFVGVAARRVGRFTIRSAMIAMRLLAGLLTTPAAL